MSTDPEQIRSEIDQTQRELSADMDALTEKLSPPRIVQRRMRRTGMAMTNVKDKIMGSSTVQGASGAWDRAASSVGETAGSTASAARDTAASTASAARDTAASTASAARDTAASTASSAVGTLRSAPETVRRNAEGNPLAAGLIAFGAGWLLASLLPASAPEQQLAGQAKDVAMEKGRPLAGHLGEAGQQAAEQLRDSAQQRAESVKETAADAASTVAGEAREAATHVTGHAQDAAGHVTGQARQAADQVADQARPS
jgi:cell division septum initiation protein DivIVA